jgi:hypothetical protein
VYESWLAHEGDPQHNGFKNLKEKMEEVKIDKTTIPFHMGSDSRIVAIDGDGTSNLTLLDFLENMNRFLTMESTGKLGETMRNMRNGLHNDDSAEDLKKKFLIDAAELEANKNDYVDWVEFAISFDE